MADSKQEEEERAWGIQIARIRTTTSTFLTLYFCNVCSYKLSAGLASISSKGQSASLNRKNGPILRAPLPGRAEKIVFYQLT
jgi:hypothetical protein